MGDKLVAIVMGSQSDWATLRHAAETFDALGIAYEARIASAHRTPERLIAFAKGAKDAGFKVIIGGAGGAAALPGMIATLTIGRAGAINAALLAAGVLALGDPAVAARLEAWRKQQADSIAERPTDAG